MKAMTTSPRLSAIALSAAALFATVAHADNYLGTSGTEGGDPVEGVTSGSTTAQNNASNTRIFSSADSAIFLINSNTTTGQPTMAVSSGLVSINTGLTVSGAVSTGAATIAGAASINTTGTATTTIGSATGTTNVAGTTTIAGITRINTTGTLATTIGSANSVTSVGGALSVTGATTASGTLTVTGATTANGTLAVSGMATTHGIDNAGRFDQVGGTNINTTGTAATQIGSATSTTYVGGATYVGGLLDVTGRITTNGLINSGAFNQTGVSTLVGTTNINTTGGALTTIGNASAGTRVGGTLEVIGQTSTHGQDNTGTFANTGVFNQTGVSTLVGATSVTGTTNINTSGSAATTIGHAGNTSAVTLASGASTVSVNNQNVSITAGTNLASNGTTGTTGSVGSGGFVAYQTAPAPVAIGESVGNVLAGAVYVNRISGNTLVDGNVYINGTLNYVSSNSATTTVTDGTINAGTSIVTAGQLGVTVDPNGRLVRSQTDQGTAAVTVTNAQGHTHGLVVNESQATLSGGTHSTSMTLNDSGARFSNAANGEPVTVTGVANGRNDFDAVNTRQFAGAVAAVGAAANIPATEVGKTASFGVGMGHFMGKSALAIGGHYRVASNTVIKGSVAAGLNKGTSKPVIGVGVGTSW